MAHPEICGANERLRRRIFEFMSSNCLPPRTAEEWLADSERYEAWTARTAWNEELSGKFRRLAADARAKAEACKA